MEPKEGMPSKRTLALIVLSVVLFKVVTQIQSSMFLWFSRTLIHCDDTITMKGNDGKPTVVTTPKKDHMDKDWSGSPYCSNRDYVGDWAQSISTAFLVTNTLCSLIFVPIFGSLSDRFGRRFLLWVSLLGVLLLLVCLALAAVVIGHENHGLVLALVVVGAAVNGATSTYGLAITSMIIDIHVRSTIATVSSDEGDTTHSAEDGIALYVGRNKAVEILGTTIGGGIGFYYTTLNIENYASLFLCLCIPQALNIILSCFVPESLPKTIRRTSLRKEETLTPVPQGAGSLLEDEVDSEVVRDAKPPLLQSQQGSICATWPLVMGNPIIRSICFFVFLFSLGGSCVVITQVFMTTQFGWSSTTVTLAIMPSALIILVSFTFSGLIIKYFGAMKSMILAASIAAVGMFLMALAWAGWLIFIAGVYTLLSSAFGMVAYVQYIAARVDQGVWGPCKQVLHLSLSLD